MLGGGIGLRAQTKWVKTNLSDLKSNDNVVIVDLTSKMAMSNDNGTQKSPKAVAVTLSSDGTELTGTITDNLKWSVISSNGNYTFNKFGSTTDHLYCTNTNKGVRVGTNENGIFTYYASEKYSGLKNSGTSRYVGVYNKQDWRCYTSINANISSTSIAYFKFTSSQTVTSLKFADGDKIFNQGQTDGLTFTNAATLTPAVEGAAITYSSSNENIAVVDNNGEVIVDATKAGTATITASYAGNNDYTASKASYTITVEPVVQNIAALKAAYSSSDITAVLKLTDAQVTCVDGYAHYLQDASGAVNVYMESGFDYKAGDKLNGFANVTYTLYNGLPEIKSFEPVGDITVTSGDAPAPIEMTITDAQKDENLCKYVVIKNVTVTPGSKAGNATAEDKEGNKINVYKSKRTFEAGQYDLIGIASIHNSTKQIAFISYAFEIDEDADANAITAGDNATVTISRTFNGNAWNTLVLPFAMTADQLTKAFGSDAKFAKYTGTTKQADGYTLNFETVTAIDANTPVFVWGAKSDVFTVEGVTVVKADATSAPANAAFSFSGSYDKTTAQSGDWFISSDNKFYSAAGTESIKPMRAVFRPVAATTNAKHLSFSIDGGETTGIKSVSSNGVVLDDHAPAYNLAGQRVDSTYKGVVIQNGKKYIRK